jgi:hypothetical protein
MFTKEFEKTAQMAVYPFRSHVLRLGGAAAKVAGHVAGIFDPGMGAKLKNAGTAESNLAKRYVTERRIPGKAQEIKNKLEHENFYRKALGKPEYKMNDEAIKRHATMKSAKETMGSDIEGHKNKSFIARNPRTALGLGIGATYLATRPTQETQSRPMLS